MATVISILNATIKVIGQLLTWSKESNLTVTKDLEFDLRLDSVKGMFVSSDGMVGISDGGKLTIKKGWELDGFSNVPDGALKRDDCNDDIPLTSQKGWVPILWRACIVHDALYKLLIEFGGSDNIFSRREADQQLRNYMFDKGVYFRGSIYYIGVRLFGWVTLKKQRSDKSID